MLEFLESKNGGGRLTSECDSVFFKKGDSTVSRFGRELSRAFLKVFQVNFVYLKVSKLFLPGVAPTLRIVASIQLFVIEVGSGVIPGNGLQNICVKISFLQPYFLGSIQMITFVFDDLLLEHFTMGKLANQRRTC